MRSVYIATTTPTPHDSIMPKAAALPLLSCEPSSQSPQVGREGVVEGEGGWGGMGRERGRGGVGEQGREL